MAVFRVPAELPSLGLQGAFWGRRGKGCQGATRTPGRGKEASGGCWAIPGRLLQPQAAWKVQEAPAFSRPLRQMHRTCDRGPGSQGPSGQSAGTLIGLGAARERSQRQGFSLFGDAQTGLSHCLTSPGGAGGGQQAIPGGTAPWEVGGSKPGLHPGARVQGRGGARGAALRGSSLVRVLQKQVHGLCQVVHVSISLHVRMPLITGPGEQDRRLDCP